MLKRVFIGCLAVGAVFSSSVAKADTFAQGSLIVPMDTTYQDNGMLRAFGLVYELLRNGVPVQWTIRPGKAHLGVDFTTAAIDHQTGAVITSHGYRGGPWVIDSVDVPKALPIVDAWQNANSSVAVHEATEPFWGDVARYLIVAPTIAMHQDGNEKIARSYLQAAGIPDSTLDPNWPQTSPDMLTPAEVAGPTTSNHHDGKLFDADGDPVYCQFMSMHWGVTEAANSPETVLEVREYLSHPVHFFAECQAVNAFEGAPPTGGRGNFLTAQGFQWPAPAQPKTLEFFNDDSPFAQLDGAFQSVGGSEPAYSLPVGGAYQVGGVVMIKKAGTPEGDSDVWMTGFLDGACPPDAEACSNNYGKVSYLGGHQYSTNLPISKNPQTQGTRLFLNSLFEAPCATRSGQPDTVLVKSAPAATADATVTFTLYYANSGSGVAISSVISDQLPSGASFVSASTGYVLDGSTVTWNLGNLGSYESGQVTLTVQLSGFGSYANTAHLAYQVGLNSFRVDSNTTSTTFDADTDGDGIVDARDICPDDYNPIQNTKKDSLSCGGCGIVCSIPNGTATCNSGACAIGTCQSGYSDCDGLYATGCEHLDSGQMCCDCAPPNGTGACVAGACTITGCNPGFSDCDKLSSNGCEYDDAGFPTDPNHCGRCDVKCSFANAAALCVAGSCQIGGCSGAYVDLDGKAANGCECYKLGVADATCDGVDDDCNGLIDDGYVPTRCGVGACASASSCQVGRLVACSPGSASVEGPAGDPTCMDGVDNDCNGTTDFTDPVCVSGAGGGGAGSGGSGGAVGTMSGGPAGTTPGGTDGLASGGAVATSSGGVEGTVVGGSDGASLGGSVAVAGGGSGGTSLDGSNVAALGGGTGASSGASNNGISGGVNRSGSGASNNGTSDAAIGASSGAASFGSRAGAAQSDMRTVGGIAGLGPTSPVVTNSKDSGGNDAGCGCRLDRGSRGGTSASMVLLALGLAFARNRRRCSRAFARRQTPSAALGNSSP
jgi:uncharacterized repeat protein (TIGR01451 family)